ncbi:hypothetical protein FRC10_005178, partial [Ceratobasidium sp. 414]
VVLPPSKECRLAIVIGPAASSTYAGHGDREGYTESNVPTREISLPPIATLGDEDVGNHADEDEEGEGEGEGEVEVEVEGEEDEDREEDELEDEEEVV